MPHILEVIEMSPVNSDLQLGALRLLTNLSVTDQHQHLLKTSIRLLLSLLVVGNEALQVGSLSLRATFATLAQCGQTLTLTVIVFQVQSLKVLVNLSSNPDMMDDIVQAQVNIRNAGTFLPTALCELKYSSYDAWHISESFFPSCCRHQLLLCCCLMPKQPLRCS